ncbi:oligosaccharide repeat unit polymerase, partial [Pelagibacterales bacterium SAG-MED32]|nr:oligosaccharide repeat unit polymerase [Pelagibacterales bacterium SAG-MED32]
MANNKIDLFVTNILFVMVLFVPFALLTGPFIPDLIVSLITLIFLVYTFTLKKWKYYQNKYFILFIIFCIYILLRSIFSSDPFLSLESSLFYFRFGIFSLAVWFLLDMKKNFIRFFSTALLIAFIFAIFDGYYQYFFEYNLFGFNGEGVRISLPFNDSMVLGNYLARLFPFFLALYFYQSQLSKYQLMALGLLFISIDVLIFSTGERTALLLLLISTIFILLFISKYRLLRSLTLIISIFILAFIASFDEGIKNRNIDQTITQLGLNQDKLIFFSHRHESHFNSAFLMFKENPLLGVGPKLFRK